MIARMETNQTPLTLSKDRDYLGRDYWTVSVSFNGDVYEECADTRSAAVKMAAPMLADSLGIKDWYITESE